MAKRSTKQMTANQLAYSKEVRRIKQAVRRAEKRGYRFFEDVIPQTPKRVTKQALQRVKEVRGERLYEKAQYLDDNTGKIVSGIEGKRLEAQERARKSAETRKRKAGGNKHYPKGGNVIADNIIDNFISKLSQSNDYSEDVDKVIREMNQPEPPLFPYTPRLTWQIEATLREMRSSKTTILNLTYLTMKEIGKEALGWRLQESGSAVDECINAIVYIGSSADMVQSACRELAGIIKGSALTMAEKMDLGEQEDYNESYEIPE